MDKKTRGERERERVRERGRERPTDTTTKNRPPAFVRKKTGISFTLHFTCAAFGRVPPRSATFSIVVPEFLSDAVGIPVGAPARSTYSFLAARRREERRERERREGGGSHLGPSYAALLTLLSHPSFLLFLLYSVQ